ncbi:hypothetical protein BSKO_11910 [Bryopsis sp. KO-2023]|nr:hypothetical protein BSKO_11910 [Bryopsis sp. KO-2023]
MLCSALEHTVLRVNLGACVETDSVGNITVLKELEEVLKDEELMKETIAAGHFLKKNNITCHTKQATPPPLSSIGPPPATPCDKPAVPLCCCDQFAGGWPLSIYRATGCPDMGPCV